MRVVAVIMCHNTPDTTDNLYRALRDHFEVLIIDSGSDPERRPKCPHEVHDNLYWTGCWQESIKRFKDADALWVIGGDVELRSSGWKLKQSMIQAFPFGCWSPSISGKARDLMLHDHCGGQLHRVNQIEGICMALSRELMHEIDKLPPAKMGWGVDVWFSWLSRKNRMRNLIDGRVEAHHPPSQGYSGYDAHAEMESVFKQSMGEGWRNVLQYYSDDFASNSLGVVNTVEKPVSIVSASYNQSRTLPIMLESIARQDVLPCEVLIADDGSSDETLQCLDDIRMPFPIRYMTRKHSGYGLVGVNNIAAQYARGDRIIWTNSDIIHNPKSVGSHGSKADNIIAGGLVSGISMPASQSVTVKDVQDWNIPELSRKNPPEMTNKEWFIRHPDQNFYGIWGGNYSVGKDLFLSVGSFNGEYHEKYGGEEADLIQRIMKAGGKPDWAKDSIAFHLEHPKRIYRKHRKGNRKYREEYMCKQ